MMHKIVFNAENDREVYESIREAVRKAKAIKPQDRSERDRAFAVVITQLETAAAYFAVYAGQEGE